MLLRSEDGKNSDASILDFPAIHEGGTHSCLRQRGQGVAASEVGGRSDQSLCLPWHNVYIKIVKEVSLKLSKLSFSRKAFWSYLNISPGTIPKSEEASTAVCRQAPRAKRYSWSVKVSVSVTEVYEHSRDTREHEDGSSLELDGSSGPRVDLRVKAAKAQEQHFEVNAEVIP